MVCAAIEAQIAEVNQRRQGRYFSLNMDSKESGLNKLVHTAYHLLDLITYFTAGVQEVRALDYSPGLEGSPGCQRNSQRL